MSVHRSFHPSPDLPKAKSGAHRHSGLSVWVPGSPLRGAPGMGVVR
jgi:hypothetical protein